MENRKKAGVAVGLGLAAIGAFLLLRKDEAPPPPPPDKATLWGTVTDKSNGQKIPGILVDCNGYAGETDSNGRYEIENIVPGTYAVQFTDPQGRYEPLMV